MGVINGNAVCQVALVVRDIEAVTKRYADLLGVEPPPIFTIPPREKAHTTYRGEPTNTRARLSVFDLGALVLELTEPDGEPSSWQEFLDEHGEGVHHIGFVVQDREKVMQYFADMGVQVRHYGEYPGGSYTFVDSAEKLGVILNIKHEVQ